MGVSTQVVIESRKIQLRSPEANRSDLQIGVDELNRVLQGLIVRHELGRLSVDDIVVAKISHNQKARGTRN
jgi:hypothetical protein